MSAIVVNQLYKSYGKTRALNGVSFSVDEGELYGIIGPDGAGKSTLFRVLTTLMLADKGDARVMGYDVVKDYRKIRDIIGYMPGKFSLYQDLTVEENLRFFATVFNSHGVQYHYRGKLPPDRGHLQANRAVQAPKGGQIIGRDEAEVGVKLRVDT